MLIYVAAIAHFDPLCRPRLHDWLQLTARRHPTGPEFVAVEWDPSHFELVRAQRPIVRKLAEARWPAATTEFLDALAAAVAFEADTHTELLPSTPVIWLDEGRAQPFEDAVATYAADRINVYASYLDRDEASFDRQTLKRMSQVAWTRLGRREPGGTDRDVRFATAISARAADASAKSAAAIVGANHASRELGYMVQRLEDLGLMCEVTELRPTGDAA